MKISGSKIKNQIITILLGAFVFIFMKSCRENQDELFNRLKNEFSISIKKAGARKFDYQYDGLSPQNSYFVGCKLQFLTLKSSGELTDTETIVIFQNDSIKKLIVRQKIYEGNTNEGGRNWNKIETDSIYIIDCKKKTKQVYVKNKHLKTLKLKNCNDFEYFVKIKKQTENNYKCR